MFRNNRRLELERETSQPDMALVSVLRMFVPHLSNRLTTLQHTVEDFAVINEGHGKWCAVLSLVSHDNNPPSIFGNGVTYAQAIVDLDRQLGRDAE